MYSCQGLTEDQGHATPNDTVSRAAAPLGIIIFHSLSILDRHTILIGPVTNARYLDTLCTTVLNFAVSYLRVIPQIIKLIYLIACLNCTMLFGKVRLLHGKPNI